MPRLAEQFVAARDNLLEEIGDRLQPALPVNETVDDVIEHRRLLSSAAPGENSIGLQVELQPAAHTPLRSGRLGLVDLSEPHRVSGASLRQQWQVGANDGCDHRVPAGRLVIDMEHDQPARWGHLDGARGHRHGQDLLGPQAQPGRLQAQTHAVDLWRDATGRGGEPLERVLRKRIELRAGDDVDLPWAACGEAMGFRPWRSQGFVLAQPSNRESITALYRPPEPSAEGPALAEGPAAEHERNIDATSNRDVGS